MAWIYDGAEPSECSVCGYDWAIAPDAALALIAAGPTQYAALLSGRDGMAGPADGGWNATAYVWHLTDLARSWAERWVQVREAPGSVLVGWDPDVLAEARNYRALPTSAALWALADSVGSFTEQSDETPYATAFEHGDWGSGTVADGIRWLGHEFHHHLLDVDARAGGVSPAGRTRSE